MQNEYHSIRVDPEHEQLLAKHKDLICASYKIEGGELKILEVEAKIGEHTGVYYRMTIRDSNRKTYKIKIEKPKTQDL